MKIHSAVLAIEATVIAAQGAISKNFDGDISHAQIRVELEGIWSVVKLIASAIDDEGVTVRGPIDLPTRGEVEAIVEKAAERAAKDSTRKRRR